MIPTWAHDVDPHAVLTAATGEVDGKETLDGSFESLIGGGWLEPAHLFELGLADAHPCRQ